MIGGREAGEALVDDARVPVLSATGSTAMGRAVGPRLAKRFARAILELGGNNGAIVAPSADLDLALRAIAFSAMGTAGQRCTTLRRLFVHDSVYDALVPKLKRAYQSVKIGSPLEQGTLVGPLIDEAGGEEDGRRARRRPQGRRRGHRRRGEIAARAGERPLPRAGAGRDAGADRAGARRNLRADPLRHALFQASTRRSPRTTPCRRACRRRSSPPICARPRLFTSAGGSDCGIANVNIGPSGAEIGGAFGGEKETGGGREAGSDAWKAYMRRATNTINYGSTLPLAQGVTFDIGLTLSIATAARQRAA